MLKFTITNKQDTNIILTSFFITFTIEVGEENVVSGNFIELCDQSGRMVYRQAITNSEVKVPTRRMKGMYIYNIISGGKAISTGKVIVQ